MSQPPAYNREADFTKNHGSVQNDSLLNSELDDVSQSINALRERQALLLKDDDTLVNNIVTKDSLTAQLQDSFNQIAVAVSTADEAKTIASEADATADEAKTTASEANATADEANTTAQNAETHALAVEKALNETVADIEEFTKAASRAAEAAETAANNAAESASDAKTEASAASTTASTALENANTALSKGLDAVTKAQTAIDTVEELQTNLPSQVETEVAKQVDDAFEEKVTAAVGNIAASKDYVDAALAKKQDVLTIDAVLSKTSTNPVQNKVIAAALAGIEGGSGSGTDTSILESLILGSVTNFSSDTTFIKSNIFQNSQLETASFPNLKSLFKYVFMDCESLTAIDLPSVTEADDEGYQFSGCVSLVNVTLPKLVNVATCMFRNCSSLEVIDLPSVGMINDGSFAGADSLTAVILRSLTVVTLADAYFSETPIGAGTAYVYVPAFLVDKYKTDENWSTYADQIRAIEDYPEICGNDDVYNIEVIDIDGTSNSYRFLKGTTISFNVNETLPSRITAELKTDQTGYQSEQTMVGSCANKFVYKFDTSPDQTYAETGVSQSLNFTFDYTAHRQTITADDLVPTTFTVDGDMTIKAYWTETQGTLTVVADTIVTPGMPG